MLARVSHVAKFSDCKVLNHSYLKILSPKQMLQRLLITFSKEKRGNTSEKLLNEIRKIIHSLYQAEEYIKKYISI